MYNLTTENLQTSFDGHLWIKTNRQKTGTETNIRLLDTAKHIIEKYHGMTEGNKLLPVPCYANCRHGIKAVAKLYISLQLNPLKQQKMKRSLISS